MEEVKVREESEVPTVENSEAPAVQRKSLSAVGIDRNIPVEEAAVLVVDDILARYGYPPDLPVEEYSQMREQLLDTAREAIIQERTAFKISVERGLQEIPKLSWRLVTVSRITTVKGTREPFIVTVGHFVWGKGEDEGWIYCPNNQEVVTRVQRFRKQKEALKFCRRLCEALKATEFETEVDGKKVIGEGWTQDLFKQMQDAYKNIAL